MSPPEITNEEIARLRAGGLIVREDYKDFLWIQLKNFAILAYHFWADFSTDRNLYGDPTWMRFYQPWVFDFEAGIYWGSEHVTESYDYALLLGIALKHTGGDTTSAEYAAKILLPGGMPTTTEPRAKT